MAPCRERRLLGNTVHICNIIPRITHWHFENKTRLKRNPKSPPLHGIGEKLRVYSNFTESTVSTLAGMKKIKIPRPLVSLKVNIHRSSNMLYSKSQRQARVAADSIKFPQPRELSLSYSNRLLAMYASRQDKQSRLLYKVHDSFY